MSSNIMFDLISALIVLLTCMPIHECAHAYVAYKLGDDTAYLQGRMDLNPLKHLDPVGSTMLIVSSLFTSFRFGWAKPVPVDPRRFHRNVTMRGGMVLVALAGPLSNILLATIVLIPARAIGYIYGASFNASYSLFLLYRILIMVVSINISIGIFNLLPIRPLDGSRVLSYFLPPRAEQFLRQYEHIIYMAAILLIFSGTLDRPLEWIFDAVFKGLYFITGFVEPLMNAIL